MFVHVLSRLLKIFLFLKVVRRLLTVRKDSYGCLHALVRVAKQNRSGSSL